MDAVLHREKLHLLSVVIPARNEEGCVVTTVENLQRELTAHDIPHEIVVVDDGSTDRTWELLQGLRQAIPQLNPVQNTGLHGFGRAIICGFDHMSGDAVVVMMADESEDSNDVVKYWDKLNEGFDCVFGSRFIRGGRTFDYPLVKLILNRAANWFLMTLFQVRMNDITNGFKAYRACVITGCRPLIAPHFNLTVEIPLKAIVRGYSWTVVPITWRNRKTGVAKFRIKEMGSRYLFICLYIWLEKLLVSSDYHRKID